MSYKMCATKRDVNTVGKPLQYFTPSQWIVKTTSYPSGYDISDNYELLQDGVLTNLKCTISLINGCVYEGMQVTINDNSLLGQLGTLHQKNYADQCTTKKYVLESNCSLTGQSASYDSNRLIREEDIIAPSTVNVYYDPRYLSVEEFKTDGISKFPVEAVDPGAPERTPGDELDPITHRDFAYSAIQCTKGNKVKVIQKSTVNSDLVLNAVYAYDNLDAPMYELNAPGHEGAEFIASETCFITFDLVQQTYRLSAAAPVIDCATKWGLTISAYIEPDGDVYYLASSGIDDPKVPMCRPSAEEYMLVPNEAEVNVSLHVNTYETANTTTFILRNLTTDETTTLTLNDDNECVFKMPSSDCRLETNVIIHEETGDTGFEYEDRILTIKSNQLERVIVNGSTYPFYDGVATVNIPCDESPSALAEVHFGAGIPAVYSIRAYATSQGPVSMPRHQSSPNTALSLSTDMTLEISYNPVSCKYSALDGKISTLDKNQMWDDDTTITNVSYSRSGDYLLATSQSITSSPSDNQFFGKDKLTTVEFYTDRPAFEITKLAFTGCSSLHEVVLPNTNLTIGEQAFDNCRSLSKLELPSSLSTLGAQVFGENAYKAIYTNPSYIDTSGQTNALTFNVDDSYNSSLTELPKYTFEFCDKLEEVYLPASITHIEKGAFHACNNLRHFKSPCLYTVSQGAFSKTFLENSSLSQDQYNTMTLSGLRCHFNGPEVMSSYVQGNNNLYICYKVFDNYSTVYIQDYAFGIADHAGAYNKHIETVILPALTLEYIGDYAFVQNKKLRIVDFQKVSTMTSPQPVQIMPYAFYDNKKLENLFAFRAERVHNSAFRNCTKLVVPEFYKSGIKRIDSYAFANAFRGAAELYKKISAIEPFVMVTAMVAYTAFCYFMLAGSLARMGVDTGLSPEAIETIENIKKIYKLAKLVLNPVPSVTVHGISFDTTKGGLTSSDLTTMLGFDANGPISYASKEEVMETLYQYLKEAGIEDLTNVFNGDLDWTTYEPGAGIGDTLFNIHYQEFIDGITLDKNGYITEMPGLTIQSIGEIDYDVDADGNVIGDVLDTSSSTVAAFKVAGLAAEALALGVGGVKFMQAVNNALWSVYQHPIKNKAWTSDWWNNYSFYTNRGVYDVLFPETLSFIGPYAFQNCEDLRSVSLTNHPFVISDGVFQGCKNLESVRMTSVVSKNGHTYEQESRDYYHIHSIGKKAFESCPLSPSSINLLILNAKIVKDYAFNNNRCIYVRYSTMMKEKSVCKMFITIPECLKTIGAFAFEGANRIQFKSLHPESLNIHVDAFRRQISDDWIENDYACTVIVVPDGLKDRYKPVIDPLFPYGKPEIFTESEYIDYCTGDNPLIW